MRRRWVQGLVAAIAISSFGCTPEKKRPRPEANASAKTAEPQSSAAYAAASVQGDAGFDAGADAGVPKFTPPRVRKLDVPEETKSPFPKAAEWTDTVRRFLVSRPEYECTLQRVREWHRVTCTCSNANASLVTGSSDGASVWASEDSAQLVFPVRRGDARVFEVQPHSKMVPAGGPYGGMAEQEGGAPFVLSQFWLEGDDAPTLVVQ